MMTEHKLKLSQKCNTVFFTQGKWALMSGMVDMIMKASDEGRSELKLVGQSIRYELFLASRPFENGFLRACSNSRTDNRARRSYALSTSYFLGQRKITLELCSLPRELPLPSELASFDVEGIEIRPIILSSIASNVEPSSTSASQRKRAHDGGGSGDDMAGPPPKLRGCAGAGEAPEAHPVLPVGAGPGAGWADAAGVSRLALNYSPYHRAHTRRRLEEPVEGQGAGVGACCYAVVMPALPGKFDAAAAKALGVPPGPLNGRLVCACVCACVRQARRDGEGGSESTMCCYQG
jgi:hypothetical protein